MSSEIRYRASSWAKPTEQDEREWATLPRDEQLSHLPDMLASPECNDVSSLTMDGVLARARAKVRNRVGG